MIGNQKSIFISGWNPNSSKDNNTFHPRWKILVPSAVLEGIAVKVSHFRKHHNSTHCLKITQKCLIWFFNISIFHQCEARSAEELKHWFKYQRHSWMNSIKQLLSTTGAFIDRVHPWMSLVLESMLRLRGAGPHFTRDGCTWDLGSSGIFFDSSPVHSSKMKFGGNSTVLES